MAPVAGSASAVQSRAPGPTNVLILSKIPDNVTEQQIAAGSGVYSEVLQVSYRAGDSDGPGWALVAFASPELARRARDRLDGKPLPGQPNPQPMDAALGEGLFGNLRSNDQNSPWKEARTPQGQVYYYHAVSRQSAWSKPPPDFPPVAPGTTAMPPAPPVPGVPLHNPLVGGVGGRPPFVVPARRPLLGGLLPPPSATVVASTGAVPAQAQAAGAIQTAQANAAATQTPSSEGTAPAGSTTSTVINAGPVGANLFIYHIPNSWDDTILRQHFEHFGKIVSCRVQKDPDGRPRGFGFVSYDAAAAAQAAIAGMHGFPVEGKHLKVQLKKGDEQQLTPTSLPPLPALPQLPPLPTIGSALGHEATAAACGAPAPAPSSAPGQMPPPVTVPPLYGRVPGATMVRPGPY